MSTPSPPTDEPDTTEWYRRPASDPVAELSVDPETGLSAEEAAERLERYGPNRIELESTPSWFSYFWRHLTEFISLLLFIVAAVSFGTYIFIPGAPIERLATAIIIFAIVLINASVGAYQEYRSVNTARELRKMMKTTGRVRRDAERFELDSEEIVPGDIVLLRPGDQVPADMRLLDTNDLQVEEAVLTGESAPVTKTADIVAEERPLAERSSMVFTNTFVTRGTGVGVVVATGRDTEIGTIARSTEAAEAEAPFVGEVQATAMRISQVAIGLVMIASTVFFLYGEDLFSIFLLAAALIVGAIPAALPVTVTYALTDAMRKMARENALVKNLALLETVGGVNVICTDKTGTLTQNQMSIDRFLLPQHASTESELAVVDADGVDAKRLDRLLTCAVLANEAERSEEGYLGDPEDVGLIEFASDRGFDPAEIRRTHRQSEFLPFSSEWKMVQSLVEEGGETVRYSKGAPEVILERCTHVRVDSDVREFTDEQKRHVSEKLAAFSSQALRNLAFSYKPAAVEGIGADTEGDVFLGAVGMWDPPREGVRDAIQTVYGAGIEVKMLTGDSKQTAVAVAKECGFEDISAVAWEDVKDASEEELEELIQTHNVFARMDPSMKMGIVDALHRLDQAVAITGDGVNDVPPIEVAEVGIAMGQRGSDITRDAADIILLDDAFPTILSAIKYGRTVLSNVRKTVDYLLTANLFEVVVVFVSALMGFAPFRALQLLWVNFATDIFPAMALGSDPPHEDIMTKTPTGKSEKILTRRVWYLLVGIGAKKVVLALTTFFAVLWLSTGTTTILGISGNLALAQTSIFAWLGLSHIVRIVAIRWDEGLTGMDIFLNKWVNYSLLWPLVAFLVILYTPLARFFQAVPLPLWTWGVLVISLLVGVVLAIFIVDIVESLVGEYGETEY